MNTTTTESSGDEKKRRRGIWKKSRFAVKRLYVMIDRCGAEQKTIRDLLRAGKHSEISKKLLFFCGARSVADFHRRVARNLDWMALLIFHDGLSDKYPHIRNRPRRSDDIPEYMKQLWSRVNFRDRLDRVRLACSEDNRVWSDWTVLTYSQREFFLPDY
jgi:hypothetical protein